MFVDIENYKSPLAIENLLTPYKKGLVVNGVRQPKEPITPQVCFEVLRSTNAPRNIKDMLQCIADLPPSEQAQFKDVVLATFSNREQPNDILVLGKKLTVASGYEAELAEAQKIKEGNFYLSGSNAAKNFISFSVSLSQKYLKSYLMDEDFSAYEKLICLSDKEIWFDPDIKFPKIIELPYSSRAFLEYTDLCNVQSIYLRDGAKVGFRKAKNLPLDLDLSRCDEVNLSGCDLSGYTNLRFKDGAIVVLADIRKFPPNLDVSMCSEVNFRESSLRGIQNLRFNDGAKVDLMMAYDLPPNLDLSKCANVDLLMCDLRDVRLLLFKNQEQEMKARASFPSDWKGKIIYTDEQPEASLNLAMTAKTKGGR